MTATSVARELAKAIWYALLFQEGKCEITGINGKRVEDLEPLITTALKRYGNERLEVAAYYSDNCGEAIANSTFQGLAEHIRNHLKEPLDV